METVRYFRDWTFDRSTGTLTGLGPLEPTSLRPFHVRMVHGPDDRLLRLEEHRPDLELPAIKLLGYADATPRIAEALDYNPDGTLRLIHRYYYDDRGRLADRHEFAGDGSSRGRVQSLWEGELESDELVFDAAGLLTGRQHYTYDADQRMTGIELYGPGDVRIGYRELRYDDDSRVSEKRWFDHSGQLQSRFVHRYDGDELAEVSLYSGDGRLCGRQSCV